MLLWFDFLSFLVGEGEGGGSPWLLLRLIGWLVSSVGDHFDWLIHLPGCLTG